MSNYSSSSFCPDSLWDLSLTWYTDDPDFTRCFHETVLVYIPAALLLLILGPGQVHSTFYVLYYVYVRGNLL